MNDLTYSFRAISQRSNGSSIADTAIDLPEALGTSPKLWMNIQATWDLEQAMKARRSA